MAGTSFKCMKCGKIFRQIHGDTTEKLHKNLTEEEKEKFKGDDFFCCGKEHLKSLNKLGMINELIQLQGEWLDIVRRTYEQ